MSVCLTKRQTEFYKFISDYKAQHGFYPSPTEAARSLNRTAPAISFLYSSLFLRGAFTDGKAQTRFHADAHVRMEKKAKIAKKKVAAKKPVDNTKLATLLVKLLSGEKVGSKEAADMIANLSQ